LDGVIGDTLRFRHVERSSLGSGQPRASMPARFLSDSPKRNSFDCGSYNYYRDVGGGVRERQGGGEPGEKAASSWLAAGRGTRPAEGRFDRMATLPVTRKGSERGRKEPMPLEVDSVPWQRILPPPRSKVGSRKRYPPFEMKL
jgi:hypothetical protein